MRTRIGNTLHIDLGSMAQMRSSCVHVELGIKTIVVHLNQGEESVQEVPVYSLSTNSLVENLVVHNDEVTIDWKSWQGIGYNLHIPGKRNLRLLSVDSPSK